MVHDLGRVLADAAWWLLGLLATMALGGLAVGTARLALGLLSGRLDALSAL